MIDKFAGHSCFFIYVLKSATYITRKSSEPYTIVRKMKVKAIERKVIIRDNKSVRKIQNNLDIVLFAKTATYKILNLLGGYEHGKITKRQFK